jgi:hypothetical protein
MDHDRKHSRQSVGLGYEPSLPIFKADIIDW